MVIINCLVVPSDSVERTTLQHVVTIEIDTKKSVHSLRSKIKKEYTPRFDDIPITEFSSNDLGKDNNTALFLSLKNGVMGTELSPISPISDITKRLSKPSSKNDIHIVVYLKIKTPQ